MLNRRLRCDGAALLLRRRWVGSHRKIEFCFFLKNTGRLVKKGLYLQILSVNMKSEFAHSPNFSVARSHFHF